MGRTLLIGSPQSSWREWIKLNRGERDHLCLDPADPTQSPPGRITLHRGDRVVAWRFYGSLDPVRAPHVLLAALARLLPQASDNVLIQAPAVRPTPLHRQLLQLIAEIVQPSEILIGPEAAIDTAGFPVGPTDVDLEPAFPIAVQIAQRKAQWIKLLEGCENHEMPLASVTFEGVRLGTGVRRMPEELFRVGLEDARHAETAGGSLLIVAEREPEERAVARALDYFHCAKAVIVEPAAYDGLLCAFARPSGEDFGMGIVLSIDFEGGVARIANTAVAPAPAKVLRLGGLRLDVAGRELGETRPWQV